MPSVYLLARDKVEQCQAMLANEVWYDAQLDHMFAQLIERLKLLDDETMEAHSTALSNQDRRKIIQLSKTLPKNPSRVPPRK